MTVGLLRGALALVTLGGLSVAAVQVTRPPAKVELPAPQAVPTVTGSAAAPRVDRKLIDRALERPAFRSDRRRASVAYDASESPVPDAPPPPAIPKPALALSGIVWGPEPVALIEGIPGTEGSTMLRRGDSITGLRVMRIERERVVIRGVDTTWNLTVRNPWP